MPERPLQAGLSALGIRAGKHALVTNVQRKEKVERSKLGNETRFPHQSDEADGAFCLMTL